MLNPSLHSFPQSTPLLRLCYTLLLNEEVGGGEVEDDGHNEADGHQDGDHHAAVHWVVHAATMIIEFIETPPTLSFVYVPRYSVVCTLFRLDYSHFKIK